MVNVVSGLDRREKMHRVVVSVDSPYLRIAVFVSPPSDVVISQSGVDNCPDTIWR